MSINVSVIALSDEQILAAIDDPEPLDQLLNHEIATHSDESCDLLDGWRLLDKFITGGEPQLGIRRGDVSYDEEMSDPAHALLSGSARDFASRLDALAGELDAAREQPLRGLSADELREVLPYFRRLRRLAQRAVRDGMGLVFCRWEGL